MFRRASFQDFIINLLETGKVPEPVVRLGIRANCKLRLHEERKRDVELECGSLMAFIESCVQADIAVVPEKANEQHYEVPSEFFSLALGKHRKYSSGYYPTGLESLDEAERHMLSLTCERAEISDGQNVLELGCGWGSLTLFMAERFRACQITALSNSNSQREYILAQARARELTNLRVITCDINEFSISQKFDRVVSVEMFEHMRNHRKLLSRVRSWLKEDGKLFIHIFCHRLYAYLYGNEGLGNWMGRNFFSGGMMPSDDLLLRYPDHFAVQKQWRVSGTHYAKTAEDWLGNMKRKRSQVVGVLAETYGREEAERWFYRWSLFFMACAELFSYRDGREWYVSHYLFGAR